MADKRINVHVISNKSGATVIEHTDANGIIRRRSIPTEYVQRSVSGSATVSAMDFEMGIPYGVPLEDILKDIVIPVSKLVNEFHKVGLWTYEDFINKPKELVGAYMSAMGVTISSFLALLKTYRSKE